MKKLLIALLAIGHIGVTYAQNPVVELSSKRLDNNTVDISYQKYSPGIYTLLLKFTTLTNASSPTESLHRVDNMQGILMTLKPQNLNQGIGYGYSSQYIQGALKPKYKPDYCYLIPFAQATRVTVVEAGYAYEKYFGTEKPGDWKCYRFLTDKADTVLAARKGVVVEVNDKNDGYVTGVEFTTKENNILVEHEDGTLMRYDGFQKKSIIVKPGDTVFPGAPLGVNASVNDKKYSVSLLLFYLYSIDFQSQKGQNLTTYKSLYKTITPQFAFNNNATPGLLENQKEYAAFMNEEIITKEMNKREIKKYKTQGHN